jgi:pimeloyl-ACP methyl ester carboxylesterase
MATVTSSDGTSIAYERQGAGPAIILIGGGLDDGAENAPLAAELAARFTVYNFARRGRGASGDTPPYAVEREIEDIAALIAEAGGEAHLFGASSGGMFALEAAAAGLRIGRIAVYEVPYDVTEDAPERYRAYREELSARLAEDRRGDALALFMRLAGASEDDIARGRGSPQWQGSEALAHTLAYDAALYGRPPADRLATVKQPTLVLIGSAGAGFYGPAADAIAQSVPQAERRVLEGQSHVADPRALAAVIAEFLSR